jgi:CheY-like chemotaxis protein
MVGFSTREASDGAAAIEVWRKWKPQLILMDMRMPVMDGMEATRRIRATAGGPEVVILALTAHAMEDKRREAASSGVNGFISKPCAEGELLQKMQVHLGLTYTYVESEEGGHAGLASLAEQTADLDLCRKLPADFIDELLQAVESGEKQHIDELIKLATEIDGRAARVLKQLSDNYEYEAINNLFTEAVYS